PPFVGHATLASKERADNRPFGPPCNALRTSVNNAWASQFENGLMLATPTGGDRSRLSERAGPSATTALAGRHSLQANSPAVGTCLADRGSHVTESPDRRRVSTTGRCLSTWVSPCGKR